MEKDGIDQGVERTIMHLVLHTLIFLPYQDLDRQEMHPLCNTAALIEQMRNWMRGLSLSSYHPITDGRGHAIQSVDERHEKLTRISGLFHNHAMEDQSE